MVRRVSTASSRVFRAVWTSSAVGTLTGSDPEALPEALPEPLPEAEASPFPPQPLRTRVRARSPASILFLIQIPPSSG